MLHIEDPLLLIKKSVSSSGDSGFSLSRYLNSPLPHAGRHVTVSLNKAFSSFILNGFGRIIIVVVVAKIAPTGSLFLLTN